MLNDLDAAHAFIGWLSAPRSSAMLRTDLKSILIAHMWSQFIEVPIYEDLMPLLKRWHDLAIKAGIDLIAVGAKPWIEKWFNDVDSDNRCWPWLFQMAWDTADPSYRQSLLVAGARWLQNSAWNPAWSFIWQRLWGYDADFDDLYIQSILWLHDNPSHPGWSFVWQDALSNIKEKDELLPRRWLPYRYRESRAQTYQSGTKLKPRPR